VPREKLVHKEFRLFALLDVGPAEIPGRNCDPIDLIEIDARLFTCVM